MQKKLIILLHAFYVISCLFYTFQLTAKIDKLSNESEDLRSKKRELESNVRKLENDMDTVSQSNSELVIDFTKKFFSLIHIYLPSI